MINKKNRNKILNFFKNKENFLIFSIIFSVILLSTGVYLVGSRISYGSAVLVIGSTIFYLSVILFVFLLP